MQYIYIKIPKNESEMEKQRLAGRSRNFSSSAFIHLPFTQHADMYTYIQTHTYKLLSCSVNARSLFSLLLSAFINLSPSLFWLFNKRCWVVHLRLALQFYAGDDTSAIWLLSLSFTLSRIVDVSLLPPYFFHNGNQKFWPALFKVSWKFSAEPGDSKIFRDI